MSKNQIRHLKYKSRRYSCRDIYSSETGDITVSVIALQSVLEKDKKSGSERVKADARERGMTVDFYLDNEEQLELSTEEIVEIMKQNGYEI